MVSALDLGSEAQRFEPDPCHSIASALRQETSGDIRLGVMHQTFPAVPIPPPWTDPRALAFFENKPANAPRRGQTSCSNAPRYR